MEVYVFLSLFVIAIIFAGFYGMIHNQISYTVSPEYFTRFKFDQFQIDPGLRNRIGASIVGWQATWWMGILVGIILIPLGLAIPGWKNYLFGMTRVFGIVMATAFITGIIALVYGYIVFNSENIHAYLYFANVNDPAAFARAGNMHNFSYLGGSIGIITGTTWIFIERHFVKKRSKAYGT